MFEHRKLTKNVFCNVLLDFEKRLKLTILSVGISEQLPTAYDGVHMKLLNLELFISKALTFSEMFFNFYVFIVVQDLGPGPPPPSRLGIN